VYLPTPGASVLGQGNLIDLLYSFPRLECFFLGEYFPGPGTIKDLDFPKYFLMYN